MWGLVRDVYHAVGVETEALRIIQARELNFGLYIQ